MNLTPTKRIALLKKIHTTIGNVLTETEAIYETYAKLKQKVDKVATDPEQHDKNLTALEALETLLSERLTIAERAFKEVAP